VTPPGPRDAAHAGLRPKAGRGFNPWAARAHAKTFVTKPTSPRCVAPAWLSWRTTTTSVSPRSGTGGVSATGRYWSASPRKTCGAGAATMGGRADETLGSVAEGIDLVSHLLIFLFPLRPRRQLSAESPKPASGSLTWVSGPGSLLNRRAG
jgi:hypothetical protein